MTARWSTALASALLAASLLAAPPTAWARPPEPSLTERNRAIMTTFADLFYTQKAVRTAFETYVKEDYIQHNPDVPDGRAVAETGLSQLFGPNANVKVLRIIVDGDFAVVHVWARFSPADRGVAVADIYRLENGKIAEHWDVVQRIPEKSRNPHGMF